MATPRGTRKPVAVRDLSLLFFVASCCLLPVLCLATLPKQILQYETLSYDTSPVLKAHHHVKRRAGIEGSGEVELSLKAYGRVFPMVLWPSRRVFPNGAKFEITSSNGSRQSIEYDMDSFYEGKVKDDPTSRVSGHIINGVFDGIVHSLGEEFHVQQSSRFFPDEKDFHSIIYRTKDVDFHPVNSSVSSGCVKEELLKKLREVQSTATPVVKRRRKKESETLARSSNRRRGARTLSDEFKQSRITKRVPTTNGNRFCRVLVAADDLFVQNIGRGNPTTAMVEIVNVFSQVQDIYSNTDFDDKDGADGIEPYIGEVMFLSPDDPDFSQSVIAVEDFLNLWSEPNHDDFCLALLLTYRDFEGGVLGLAWVADASGSNSGGICERRVNLRIGERSLNTAIVTFLNYGLEQPRTVSVVTIAHEFGHNFGSNHDPGSVSCSPGGSEGNFIMFPMATNGNLPNNKRFSSCSRMEIAAVLADNSGCFDDGTFCGNGIIEAGEECDCGDMDECASDPCCNDDMSCTLRDGAVCSNSQECCTDLCTYVSSGQECRSETECRESAKCTGDRGACPPSVLRTGTCNEGRNLCENGLCSGSLCRANGLEDCLCDEIERQCEVCCRDPGNSTKCTSTFLLDDIVGETRSPGSACNDFQGYCSDSNPPTCQVVDNQDVLNDLLDLLTLETLNRFAQWLLDNWYVPVCVIVGIMILLCLLHVTYRKRKPVKKAVRRARNSIRGRHPQEEQDRGGVSVGRASGRNVKGITPREGLNRLRHFFPTADPDTIVSVMQSCQEEAKAVQRLLELGFPFKKVPIPTNRI